MSAVSHISDIIRLIRTNKKSVLSITVPLGSGILIDLPFIISNGMSDLIRCFVSVPDTNIMKILADHERRSQRDNLGRGAKEIGTADYRDISYNDNSRIVYATNRFIRDKMFQFFSRGKSSPIDFCDILILDETVSGTLDADIIVALWEKAASSGSKVPKLIVLGSGERKFKRGTLVDHYSISLPKRETNIRYSDVAINTEKLNVVADILLSIYRNGGEEDEEETRHILIFSDDSSQINEISVIISRALIETGRTNNLVYSIHDDIRDEDVQEANSPSWKRKTIICSQAISSIITLDNIGYVIDMMTEKIRISNNSGGERVSHRYIDKNTAIRRSNRASGRSPICYRLCTESFFNSLPSNNQPEVERISIDHLMIEILGSGLDLSDLLPSIDRDRITKSAELVTRLGMIKRSNEGYHITPMGRFASSMKLSVRNCSYLWYWINGIRFPQSVTENIVDIGIDYSEIETTAANKSLFPRELPYLSSLFLKEIEEEDTSFIIDITANIGIGTILFRKLYPGALIYSVERDADAVITLSNNVKRISSIIGTDIRGEHEVFNQSAVNFIKNYPSDQMTAGTIFFSSLEELSNDLQLDGIPIGIVAGDVISRLVAVTVVIKASVSADITKIRNDIASVVEDEITVSSYIVGPEKEPYYQLIFARMADPAVSASEAITIPRPKKVPIRSYHLYSGIITASLIDAYGPSYFDTTKYDRFIKKMGFLIGDSDIDTYLNLWNYMMKEGRKRGSNDIPFDFRDIDKWCRDNHCNGEKIRELFSSIRGVIWSLGKQGYEVSTREIKVADTVKKSIEIFDLSYDDYVAVKRDGRIYRVGNIGEYDLLDSMISKVSQFPPNNIIALILSESHIELAINKEYPLITGNVSKTEKGVPNYHIPSERTGHSRSESHETKDLEETLKQLENITISEASFTDPDIEMLPQLFQQIKGRKPVNIAEEFSRALAAKKVEQSLIDLIDHMFTSENPYSLDFQGPKRRVPQVSATEEYHAVRLLCQNVLDTLMMSLANDGIGMGSEMIRDDHPLFIDARRHLMKKLNNNEKAVSAIIDVFLSMRSKIRIGSGEAPKITLTDTSISIQLGNEEIVRELDRRRLELLLSLGTKEDLAASVLRYMSIISRDNQLSIPKPIYEMLHREYDVTVEGFGSPFNSQLLFYGSNSYYCSMFLDTDFPFESLGSFFDNNFDGVSVLANPPRITSIISKTVAHIIDQLSKSKDGLRFFITVPNRDEDSKEYLSVLKSSQYLKGEIDLKEDQYYVEDTRGATKDEFSNFDISLFLLANGGTEVDISLLEARLKKIYKAGYDRRVEKHIRLGGNIPKEKRKH